MVIASNMDDYIPNIKTLFIVQTDRTIIGEHTNEAYGYFNLI